MSIVQQINSRGTKVSKGRQVFSLHRYYMWANRMRTHFDEKLPTPDEQLKSGCTTVTNEEIEAYLYMSYWCAGLYVVIEGWRQLGLADPVVDDLLKSPKVGLLKTIPKRCLSFSEGLLRQAVRGFHGRGAKCCGLGKRP